MSASEYRNETELSERFLEANLIPLISVAFLGGSGFTILMGHLGFREEPLIFFIWDYLYVIEIAEHVLKFGTLFSLMSLIYGLLKFWLSDSLLENLSTLVYVVMAGPVLWIANYPLDLTSLFQGGIIILLQTSFLLIPGYLLSRYDLPEKTESGYVKTKVFIGSFVIAALLTLIAVIGMGLIECSLSGTYICK